MISPITGANQDYIGAVPDSAGANRVRWRAALNARWHRKLDEVVALSAACEDSASVDADRAVAPSLRLHDRASIAFDDLAAIEDAMARVDAGTYGRCAACGQQMPEEWLAEEPQIRHCPDCALLLVAWRSPRPRLAKMVPHPAPANRAPHQPSARSVTVILPVPA
jgi:DnaK suppressor protein